MGRARENFNDVYFKDLRGQQMSFAGYANVLRHIFWNLMDGHSMVRESEKCNYTIEAGDAAAIWFRPTAKPRQSTAMKS